MSRKTVVQRGTMDLSSMLGSSNVKRDDKILVRVSGQTALFCTKTANASNSAANEEAETRIARGEKTDRARAATKSSEAAKAIEMVEANCKKNGFERLDQFSERLEAMESILEELKNKLNTSSSDASKILDLLKEAK